MVVSKVFALLSSRRNNNPLELEWGKEGGGGAGGRGEQVVALHDFAGESNRELSFRQGDVLTVINKFHPDWWEAQCNGRVGIIPSNFVDTTTTTSTTNTTTNTTSTNTTSTNRDRDREDNRDRDRDGDINNGDYGHFPSDEQDTQPLHDEYKSSTTK